MTTLAPTPKAPAPPRLIAHVAGDYGLFFCPGCELPHALYLGPTPPEDNKPIPYNGRPTAPTFVGAMGTPAREQIYVVPHCVFSVTGGRITFDKSSDHRLAGSVVALPEWPKGSWPNDKVPEVAINRNKMP